jgi:phage terminase large subunit-like protein
MFDEDKANKALQFIEYLKLTEGKWGGHPIELIPWQRKLITDLFGNVDENGNRLYRTAYVEIPKKSGKSPLAAAIALNLLFNDDEEGAQIYSAATERDQAAIVFRIAAKMVRQSPALMKRCKIIDSQKTIAVHKTGSFYRAISSESHSKHGFNIHGLIFDELHALKDREFYATLTEGTGDARTQPLFLTITTAGYDRNSVCWEMHEYAEKVEKGIIEDPHFYSMVYSLPEDEDWEDEENWKKVNPSLGSILDLERIRDHYKAAVATPSRINDFRRFRLCQWTQAESRFLNISDWDATAGLLKEDELERRPCYAGLDLSSNIDITALVLVFPMEDGTFRVVPRFWIPEDNMRERSKKDRVPYEVWVRNGFITATPGNVIDYEWIKDEVRKLAKRYRLKEIAYDRFGATQLAQDFINDGLEVIPFGQGMVSMSGPTKELEKLVLSRQLVHGGNPVLRWMADNLVVTMDAAGNIKPAKDKSTEKIDGMVALIMGLDRAIRNAPKESVYKRRGILVL